MKRFSEKIIHWYKTNKRDLPWRNTNDAYLIWLSEIILQQTRVEQGKDYYLKFAKTFPTVRHLAKADNEKVMKLWQGLGYYSRARNLHETSKIITNKFKGKFPEEYNDILSLKGVGEYTAAAIASFAFNKPYAVVDGNVYRVLARVFGIETAIDSTQGKKEFNLLANELLDKKNPSTHNQAIMEFGAMQCKPVNPDCSACILNTMCFVYSKKRVSDLPLKSKKTKVRKRYFNYIVLNHQQSIAIKKRTEKDIWKNLYDFPLIETEGGLSEHDFLKSNEWGKFIGSNTYNVKSISREYKHILSHQIIYARFYEIETIKMFKQTPAINLIFIKKNEFKRYAVSRLMEKFMKSKK